MKKIIVCALALAFALPCSAQKNPFKWWRALRSSAPKPAVHPPAVHPVPQPEPVPSFRVLQGKILPSPGRPVVSARQLELEKFVARPVELTAPKDLVFIPEHEVEQAIFFALRYEKIMEKFKQFKKEMNPFLYYRLKEPQGKDLLPQERQMLLPKVSDMETELLRLSEMVNPKKDKALAFALEYVTRVRDEIIPDLKGISLRARYFHRTDRSFVGNEFYLYEPEKKTWRHFLRRKISIKPSFELPKGLRVAVLNDRESLLRSMKTAHQNGVFIRGGELDCFDQADNLLDAVRAGKKYDVILTDIIIPGGGGFYVTKMLRIDGYQGTIIALSSFERDDAMGRKMFLSGFDGMINPPIGFESSPLWSSDIMRSLHKYFQLRRLNHWQR